MDNKVDLKKVVLFEGKEEAMMEAQRQAVAAIAGLMRKDESDVFGNIDKVMVDMCLEYQAAVTLIQRNYDNAMALLNKVSK